MALKGMKPTHAQVMKVRAKMTRESVMATAALRNGNVKEYRRHADEVEVCHNWIEVYT